MRSRWMALLFSPFGLLLLSAGRLMIISDFNSTTATTIASSGGYVNTLLGSVIPLVPIFIPYVALLLLLFRHFVLSILSFLFTAFITPTFVSLPIALRLVRLEEHQLVAALCGHRPITLVIALFVGVVVWLYTGSFVEAVSSLLATAVTAALLLTAFTAAPSLPSALRPAEKGVQRLRLVAEQELLPWVTVYHVIIIVIALLLIFIIAFYRSATLRLLAAFAGLLTTAVAVIATLTLFPYVVNFYPLPHTSGYYVDTLRSLWLPGEKITLSSGRVYYGYTLSTSDGWFTVLLANSRKMAYVPAGDVIGQAVCQPVQPNQLRPGPPLIPLFYTRPPGLPTCAHHDISAPVTAVLSEGEALNVISSLVHVPAAQIISQTNAYQHQELSSAMRAYERCGNWNAPTPIGQRFWYYPPISS